MGWFITIVMITVIYMTRRVPNESTFNGKEYGGRLSLVPVMMIPSTRDEFVPVEGARHGSAGPLARRCCPPGSGRHLVSLRGRPQQDLRGRNSPSSSPRPFAVPFVLFAEISFSVYQVNARSLSEMMISSLDLSTHSTPIISSGISLVKAHHPSWLSRSLDSPESARLTGAFEMDHRVPRGEATGTLGQRPLPHRSAS